MKFLYILGLLILIPLASAESTITNAYFPDSKIIINTTNNITNFSTPPDAPANYLQLYINNSMIQFNAISNTTISNISFLNDKWSFKVNGTGYLNILSTMNSILAYTLYIDTTNTISYQADSFYNVSFNRSLSSSEQLFEIYVVPTSSVSSYIAGGYYGVSQLVDNIITSLTDNNTDSNITANNPSNISSPKQEIKKIITSNKTSIKKSLIVIIFILLGLSVILLIRK